MELSFVDKAHKGKALVHLSQVEHNVLVLSARMVQPNDGRTFLVKLQCSSLLVNTINARNVDEDINQFRTDFIVLHFHWVRVCCYVNLRDDIEEESFLDFGVLNEGVHHLGDVVHLWQQLLDHLRESFVDRVVIDRSEVERESNLQAVVIEQLPHDLLDLIQRLHLLLVIREHVSVDLVDEHFVGDVLVQARGKFDDVSQPLAWLLKLLLLRINHVNQRPALLEKSGVCGVVLAELLHSWEVLD